MNSCNFGLLLFLILILNGKSTPAGARDDRVWKAKKAACEKEVCSNFLPDENYNCVNECTSSKCYSEIYAENPLEDGEIDNYRQKKFFTCLRSEVKSNRYAEAKQRGTQNIDKSNSQQKEANDETVDVVQEGEDISERYEEGITSENDS